MKISDYHHQTFRYDLAAFMGQSSVPYFGLSWRYDCRGLESVSVASRPFFLVCLYFTVLVDQAMHEHYRSHYSRFEQLTRYPKFCHGLGQFQHNPRAILSVPIEHGLVNADELHAQLAPGMELFVAEVVAFFRDHMTDISAAEFFGHLTHDRDVQIPLLVALLDKTVAESTDYRAYSALQQAILNAGLGRGSGSGSELNGQVKSNRLRGFTRSTAMTVAEYCQRTDRFIFRQISQGTVPIPILLDREGWKRVSQVWGRHRRDLPEGAWERLCRIRGDAGPPAGPYT